MGAVAAKRNNSTFGCLLPIVVAAVVVLVLVKMR